MPTQSSKKVRAKANENMINRTLTIAKSAGQRLDIFLSKELHVSRSQTQKMIEQGLVMVNGKLPKKAGDRVSEGVLIEIKSPPKINNETMKQWNNDKGRLSNEQIRQIKQYEIKIIAEENDYIVVDKPSGMLTHPTDAEEKNTLVDVLVKKYPEIKSVGKTSPRPLLKKRKDDRPGIVHRLDKEASGLLVVARTPEMFEHLKKQFKDRTVEKEYIALAHGRIPADGGELAFPIARSKDKERMAALPLSSMTCPPLPKRGRQGGGGEGKEALTEFFVEKRFVNFSLVHIKLHTGRMHQIRVHFFAYGHPLVGDPLYFAKKKKRTWDEKLGRLFLHSAKLGFTNLKGEKKVFASPLPEELEEFLLQLK